MFPTLSLQKISPHTYKKKNASHLIENIVMTLPWKQDTSTFKVSLFTPLDHQNSERKVKVK